MVYVDTLRKKEVWFVNHHAQIPSKDGRSGRHINFARQLPESGWNASLIVASTSHPSGSQKMKELRLHKLTSEFGVDTLWIRTIAYGKSTLLRFLGMFVFAATLLLPGMTRGLKKPDVIVGSTVHPLAAWAAWKLAKRYKVPFVYEIRDVWPDTLIDLGHLSRTSPLARGMEWLSTMLAEKANLILSPLPAVDSYLKHHNIRDVPFLWVSNGIDKSREIAEPQLVSGNSVSFMYLGSHGHANALAPLLQCFDEACKRRPDADMTLRLVGSGPLKSSLQNFASELNSSTRIRFEDEIPSDQVTERAREADFLVANMFDSPVYRYGISLNKLYSYMFAFRPIIFASNAQNNPVDDARCGISVYAEDTEALTSAFLRAYDSNIDERYSWAKNGYEYVLREFSHRTLSQKLAIGLDALID